MPVYIEGIPSKIPKLPCQRFFIFYLGDRPVLLDAVIIDYCAEIVQFMLRGGHSGLPDLPFLHLAVAEQAIDFEILLPYLRAERHAVSDGQAFAEGPRRKLHPGDTGIDMSLKPAA